MALLRSWLHIIFTFFLIKLTFLLSCSVLILLVLGDEVVHVTLGFRELHFVHTLSCVPMQESLATKHCGEVLCDPLEHFLNGCRVLVLHVEHLFIDFFGGHSSTKECSSCQVTAMAGVSGAHHVLCIKHLLGELRNSECTVLLRPTRCEWSETSHEEVKARERDQIYSDFAEITIQLPREAEAASHATHGSTDKMVQVTVGGCRQLQSAKADIIQCFVIQKETLVGILHPMMEREHGIVGLHNGIRHFRAWNDTEGLHDAVWVLLTHLGDEESSHACTCATSKRVTQLEALQTVTTFGFFTNYIKHRINELCTFSVVPFCPVVSGPCLAEYKVVRTKQLTKRTSANTVHCAWLQIHKNCAWDIATTSGLVEIDVDALELQV